MGFKKLEGQRVDNEWGFTFDEAGKKALPPALMCTNP